MTTLNHVKTPCSRTIGFVIKKKTRRCINDVCTEDPGTSAANGFNNIVSSTELILECTRFLKKSKISGKFADLPSIYSKLLLTLFFMVNAPLKLQNIYTVTLLKFGGFWRL